MTPTPEERAQHTVHALWEPIRNDKAGQADAILTAAFREVARECAMIADMAEKPEEAGTLIRQQFGLEKKMDNIPMVTPSACKLCGVKDSKLAGKDTEIERLKAELQKAKGLLRAQDALVLATKRRAVEIAEPVLIGGNHLASSMVSRFGPKFPLHTEDPESVRRTWFKSVDDYDLWVAWRAIMQFRDALIREWPEAAKGERDA